MKIRPDTELAWARPIARPEIMRQQPKAKPPTMSAAQPRPETQPAPAAAAAQPVRIVPRGSFINVRV